MNDTSKMRYMTKLRGAGLTPAEHLVLTTLWTYTSADLTHAHPGRERLQGDTGLSREGVRIALRSLEEKGFIVLVEKGGYRGKRKMADVYDLSLPTQLAQDANSVGADLPTQLPPSDPSHQIITSDPSPTPSPLRDDADSSLRSPSLSERRSDLLEAVKEISRATTDDEYEAASETFIAAFEDRYGEEIGYWDYGWSNSLDRHVRDHGIDYGSAKWLGIFTNTRNAA